MSIIETLKVLSELSGASGYEHAVREDICKMIEGHCEYHIDPLGNIIAFKKGKKDSKNKVMFSAHMDEVGFIITYIEDNGLLRFQQVGGVDTRVAYGKAVEVGPDRIAGTIGGKATHMLTSEERKEPASYDSMFIDIGATSKEEASKYVKLGQRAVFLSPFQHFGTNKILGKAFDDRAGIAMMIDMIKNGIEYDCYFSFSVMEEVGCIGGQTAAYGIMPDYGFAIETTTASDIGGVSPSSHVCVQGNGATISFMDKGTAYDAELFDLIFATAKENALPCQEKMGVYGGTEGRAIQTTGIGTKTITMSLPCRYLHSASCVLDTRDIESMRKLMEAVLEKVAVI